MSHAVVSLKSMSMFPKRHTSNNFEKKLTIRISCPGVLLGKGEHPRRNPCHTSAWVFFSKFTTYFQNTFS